MSSKARPSVPQDRKPHTFSIAGLGIVCLAIFFILATNVNAAQVTVAWDPSSSAGVTGYKLYTGTTSGAYQASYDAGSSTSYVITGINGGNSVYFAATAYDSSGNESAYSSELTCQTLVASSGSNGSISPAGTTVVANGSSQTYTITPNAGFRVADVLVDGVSQGAVSSYTFSSVSAPHAISVTFAAQTVTITASAGSHGSISPSGAVSVAYGGSQSFTITADTGYTISDVVVDGISKGGISSYVFSLVNEAHTISATFASQTFAITASAGSNGSISPSGGTSVNYGASQTYTITPNTGYTVSDVLVDGVSKGAVTSYTFSSVSAAHTISAVFASQTFAITASAGSNGSISPSGATSVNYGASQIYTITPNTGYKISDVLVDGVSKGAITSYTFSSVSAAHTISAVFASQTFAITASAGLHGSISPAGSVSVNSGASQTFTIAADSGYRISDVLVDGVSQGATASYTFSSVAADHTIAAVFDTPIHILTDVSSIGVAGLATTGVNVRLNAKPSSNVTVSISWLEQDSGETADSGKIVAFTTTNWNTAQQIKIATHPDFADGEHNAVLHFSAAGLVPSDVAITGAALQVDPIHVLTGTDGTAAPLVAVLKANVQTGVNEVEVKDSKSGLAVNSLTFDTTAAPKALGVASFVGSNGVAQLLVDPLTGSASVEIRNAGTNAQLNTIVLDTTYAPKRMVVLPDMNSDGVSELAVLGVNASTTAVRAQILNPLTGAVIRNISYTSGRVPRALAVIPSINASGNSGLALLSKVTTTGYTMVQIYNANTGALVKDISFGLGFNPIALGVLANIPSANTAELAVVGVDTYNRVIMFVANALTGTLVNSAVFGSIAYPIAIEVVPDINKNGIPEIAVLGWSTDGVPVVQLKDAHAGGTLKAVKLSKITDPVGLAIVPDVNGSSYPEIAVLGTDKTTLAPAVEIRDAKSNSLVNYIEY